MIKKFKDWYSSLKLWQQICVIATLPIIVIIYLLMIYAGGDKLLQQSIGYLKTDRDVAVKETKETIKQLDKETKKIIKKQNAIIAKIEETNAQASNTLSDTNNANNFAELESIRRKIAGDKDPT